MAFLCAAYQAEVVIDDVLLKQILRFQHVPMMQRGYLVVDGTDKNSTATVSSCMAARRRKQKVGLTLLHERAPLQHHHLVWNTQVPMPMR